jgi:hypothetical protein
MPVVAHDRPIDALREEAVDRLIMNYGHGKLSREAFERRLDEALDTKSHDKLLELTADLDLAADKQYASRKKAELDIRLDDSAAAQVDDVWHMVNIFGGSTRRGAWDVPREIRMLNLFGGAELDFTDARFSAQTTRITMFCMFGGASFYVREGMRTVTKTFAIFGGIDDRAPSSPDRNAPTLIIQGVALFGGAEIKIKKTAKQRLHEFASTLKTMFNATEPPRA